MAAPEQQKKFYAAGGFLAFVAVAIGGLLWCAHRRFDLPGDHWMEEAWGDARSWAVDRSRRSGATASLAVRLLRVQRVPG